MIEPTDATLRRWLLQQLPPDDAAPLEQRLLEDADFGERVDAAETDLLDDFARGRLDEPERAAAARLLTATPHDRIRLRIAVALARLTGRSPAALRLRHAATPATQRHAGAAQRRRLGIGGAIAACALIAVGIGVTLRHGGVAPGNEATITLLANQPRGTRMTSIAIPPSTTSVRMQAEVDAAGADQRYTLDIEVDGRPVFMRNALSARESGPYRFVEVSVPATALRGGEHRVRVVAEGAASGESAWVIRVRDQ